MKSPLHLVYLAALSAVIVLSYDFVLKSSAYHPSEDTLDAQLRFVKELRSRYTVDPPANPPAKDEVEAKRRRALLEKRLLAVVKNKWPECIDTSKFTKHQKEVHMVNSRLRRSKDYQYGPKLTGLECKAFIDEEILNGKDGPNNDGNEYFTGQDKLTRVILRPKRKPSDPWYNTVVIPMDDQDIVQGRDLNGQVYYDFTWDGSGEAATADQEADIPPIIATETTAGSPATVQDNPDVLVPASPEYMPEADPNSEEYAPLELPEDISPMVVEGGTVEGTLIGTDTMTAEEYAAENPIAGGVAIDPLAPDATTPTAENPDADIEFQSTITNLLNTEVAEAGERELDSIDCTGLNGINCCLLIKATYHDADTSGRSLQCTLDYVEGSNKKLFLNNRGQKVIIQENHNGLVNNEPKLIGNWPAVSDPDGWVEDGGDPNQIYG